MASTGSGSVSSEPSSSSGRRVSNSDNGWKKNILCRYYLTGCCRAGQNCPFSHDRSISNKGTLPCKYFSQGTCANGNNCRFSHERVKSSSTNLVHTSDGSSQGSTSWAEAPEFVPRSNTYYSDGSNSSYLIGSDSSGYGDYLNQSGYGEVFETSGTFPSQQVIAPLIRPLSQAPKSWAHIVNPVVMAEMTIADAESQLCPFYLMGECRYNEHCSSIHGDMCDLCSKPALHPNHERQRKQHTQQCMKEHEEEMELAFAVARSKDKTCGICMEVIIEKPKSEARFGIMPSCNHCFCLACLRKWRQAKQFEHKIIRACPECRQTSDYVCPSHYWIDTKEEKEKLFNNYKEALTKKECKYFRKGEGECPFGNKCFYRHEAPDGTLVDTGPPPRRTRQQNADGEITVGTMLLYNFFEEREARMLAPLGLDILDLLDFFSDLDDSD